jgi:hypothetical protein
MSAPFRDYVPRRAQRERNAYDFNRRNDNRFFALGWNGVQSKYFFLRSLGWREVQESKKVRWFWGHPIEKSRDCRQIEGRAHPFVPHRHVRAV